MEVTVILTVAVSVTPPDATVYVNDGAPLKFKFGVNVRLPAASSLTVPPVTLTEPPTVMAEPLMAVMAWTGFSKVSFANGANVTGVSSFVAIESSVISATGDTVIATVLATEGAMPSEVETVRVTGAAGDPVL